MSLTLQQLTEKIANQQKAMGYTDYINIGPKEQMGYLRDVSLALVVEVVEMLQELPWKPWKAIEDQPLNLEKAAEESVDALVFLIDTMLIINPQIDLEDLILRVLDKIDKRIAGHYGKQS